MPHESILAHLAPLLTSQIENIATDALAHLLLQYHFLADAFQEYISSVGVELPEDLSFKTQARWQGSAIPDLVGLDEEGHYLLIVESKFWAPLTTNQPTTYIDLLPPDKPAVLLFIAPASRRTALWLELLRRCNLSSVNGQSQQEKTTAQFLTIGLNRNHILALTSWESLLEKLNKKASQVKDEYATGDIWQLRSLCAKIDADAFQPLTEDEITSPTKKRIFQFRALIDELVNRLVDSGIVSIAGYKATPGPDYYKRYMSINGYINWCIEFNERYRKQYPPTNLWLTTTVTPAISGLLTELTQVSYRQGRQFLIPLEIPISVERESVLTSLYQQVIDVSRRLIRQ